MTTAEEHADPVTIYQHPLAYLIGLEGLALLRGWAGDVDRPFIESRLAEVRALVQDPQLALHPGVVVRRTTTEDGYRQWARTYDQPNSLFDIDEPVVQGILNDFPAGTALDAACGTGRYASWLSERGHRVVGVDRSTEMLDVARRRVPAADFRTGDLEDLPVDGDSVDLVVCTLALCHVQDLRPVFSEFARVLRPGGHLVISDTHHEQVTRGSVVKAPGPNGEPGVVPTFRHTPGTYLRAALGASFDVRGCEEPGAPTAELDGRAPSTDPPGPWEGWPWSLLDRIPEAVWAAWATPAAIVWHFQRPAEAAVGSG